MEVIHSKLLICLMPTWGCEKACRVGIKSCCYSSGYFNKTLYSRALVIQALLCATADKGKPENLCWVSALHPAHDRNANQDQLLAWDISPWTSFSHFKKVHLRVFLDFCFRGSRLVEGKNSPGKWVQRIKQQSSACPLAGPPHSEEPASQKTERQTKGRSKRKDCI